MVWLVLRRRARRESVSCWTGASSTFFELHCRAHHGFVREQRTRDRHFRFPRLRILRACLDGFAVYIIGMVIDDFSDLPRQPKILWTPEGFLRIFSAMQLVPAFATTVHSSVVGYNTSLEPEIVLKISQHVLAFALHPPPPHPSWLSPFRFSSATRVACWISILPFGPIESQPRPPSIPHVLLFLAIKSHVLSVVFSHDASVMLMKSQ